MSFNLRYPVTAIEDVRAIDGAPRASKPKRDMFTAAFVSRLDLEATRKTKETRLIFAIGSITMPTNRTSTRSVPRIDVNHVNTDLFCLVGYVLAKFVKTPEKGVAGKGVTRFYRGGIPLSAKAVQSPAAFL